MTDDTRERLIRLEEQVKHLNRSVDDMADTVRELKDLLAQAKGARWAIIGVASLAGFFAGKLSLLAQWFK